MCPIPLWFKFKFYIEYVFLLLPKKSSLWCMTGNELTSSYINFHPIPLFLGFCHTPLSMLPHNFKFWAVKLMHLCLVFSAYTLGYNYLLVTKSVTIPLFICFHFPKICGHALAPAVFYSFVIVLKVLCLLYSFTLFQQKSYNMRRKLLVINWSSLTSLTKIISWCLKFFNEFSSH